jgi:transposase
VTTTEVQKTPMMRTLEAAYRRDIRQVIQDLYRETGSIPGVARALCVSKESVYTWIELLNGSEALEFEGWEPEREAVSAEVA